MGRVERMAIMGRGGEGGHIESGKHWRPLLSNLIVTVGGRGGEEEEEEERRRKEKNI